VHLGHREELTMILINFIKANFTMACVLKKTKLIENKVPTKNLNKIYCKSSEKMDELPDNSIHLMVTSPPYNVTKEYDNDLSLKEYLELLNTVWKETYRVLVPGGRVCVNVTNLARKPYIPLHSYIIEGMQKIGYLMCGEIIWNKASSASPSTAWGSWLSTANPVLRDIHEYILIFSKDTFSRKKFNYDINPGYVKLAEERISKRSNYPA